MVIEPTTQKVNLQYNPNNSTLQTDKQFSSVLNDTIESVIPKNNLPQNAKEQLRQDWINSLTDEKFEELLGTLGIDNLSDGEKKLYKSIIEDRYITNEEVKDLSFEQLEVLGKFIMHKTGEESYVEETLINMDQVAGHLIDSTVVSDNKNFNKAIYEMAKSMENDEGNLAFFMAEITGVHGGGSIAAFPELQSKHYKGKDIQQEIENIISTYKDKAFSSKDNATIEFCEIKVQQFTSLLNIFKQLSDPENSEINYKELIVEPLDRTKRLVEDLLSLMKTGLTVSEIEELEELIAEINKLIEDSKEKNISEKKIEDMIEKLEQKINELKERMGIKEFEETEDKESDSAKEDQQLSQIMKKFKSMVDNLEDALKQIKEKSNETNFFTSTQEEMELRKQIRT